MNNILQDRIRGSLVGGAVGDALGYPVEFLSVNEIYKRYGKRGITQLDKKQNNYEKDSYKALISDDTQMTLFTANGILNAKRLKIPVLKGICRAYIEWYFTQSGMKSVEYKDCWISDISDLNHLRAPGNTCMNALYNLSEGREAENNSNGCGGVMRVAPIPLYAACEDRMSIEDTDKMAGKAAEITHHHPLGFISAALMAHVIYKLVLDAAPTA